MSRPFLGFGLGLRTDHYQYVIEHRPQADWFEIISENYMVPGGKPLANLDKICADYPVVMHGVSMLIGSTDPLNQGYLEKLKGLIERVEPLWVPDHLCWTHVDQVNSHDLLLLPYDEATINHLADRISQVQYFLGRPILIENLSSYVCCTQSEMPEWEFVSEIVKRSGCYLLLDINNIFVSAHNHHFKPETYIDAIPSERVMQFHLAGHSYNGDMIIDTHDHDVCDPVWALYEYALRRFGAVSTMIERDDNIPPFTELRAELAIAEAIAAKTLTEQQLEISGRALLRGAA